MNPLQVLSQPLKTIHVCIFCDWICHDILYIHGPQRINHHDFGNPMPPADQSFHLFCKTSQCLWRGWIGTKMLNRHSCPPSGGIILIPPSFNLVPPSGQNSNLSMKSFTCLDLTFSLFTDALQGLYLNDPFLSFCFGLVKSLILFSTFFFLSLKEKDYAKSNYWNSRPENGASSKCTAHNTITQSVNTMKWHW